MIKKLMTGDCACYTGLKACGLWSTAGSSSLISQCVWRSVDGVDVNLRLGDTAECCFRFRRVFVKAWTYHTDEHSVFRDQGFAHRIL